nr:ABC transporter permease [Acholeplasmatales bacterium]
NINDTNFKLLEASKKDDVKIDETIEYCNDNYIDKKGNKLSIIFNIIRKSFHDFSNASKKILFFRFTLLLIGALCAVLAILEFKFSYKDYSSYNGAKGTYELRSSDAKVKYKNEATREKLYELYENNNVKDVYVKGEETISLYNDSKYIESKEYETTLLPYSFNEYKIIYGNDNFQKSDEIVISKYVADLLRVNMSYDSLIGRTIVETHDNTLLRRYPGVYYHKKIIGITNSMYNETFFNKVVVDFDYYGNDYYKAVEDGYNLVYRNGVNILSKYFNLEAGRLPENNKEILVVNNAINSVREEWYYEGFKIVGVLHWTQEATDSGFYNSRITNVFSEDAFDLRLRYRAINYYTPIIKFDNDVNNTEYDNLRTSENLFFEDINTNTDGAKKSVLIPVIILSMVLVVYIYFTERVKLISHVKEIGILRAIGEPRIRLILRTALDSLIEAIFTSAIGYILVGTIAGVSESILRSLNHTKEVLFYENPLFYITFIIMMLIFVLFGSLPSVFLLKKTPSEIIAKYDL